MTIDLSFTQDPEWRTEREKQWDEYEATESDHYTKKQLAVRKTYFLNGELTSQDNDKLRIGEGALIVMYPLKTAEAWEHVCRELMSGRRRYGGEPEGYYSLLEGLVNSVIGELRQGWSHEEQCALFDWLLGERFQHEIVPPVPVGPRGIQPTHRLNPDRLFRSATTRLYFWLKDVAQERQRPVWASRLDFLMSLFPLVDKRAFDLEKYDRSVGKLIPVAELQDKLQRILGYMKDYPPEEAPEEAVAERRQFLDEFRQRLEALDPKPGRLRKLLDHYLK